jgi:toxin YoeB
MLPGSGMSVWTLHYTPHAKEDWQKLKDSGQARLLDRVRSLLQVLEQSPYANPPPFKKLQGDYYGAYSRRINDKHRLVYQVMKDQKAIKVLACWSHYDN